MKKLAVFFFSLCAAAGAVTAQVENFVVIFTDEMIPEYIGAYDVKQDFNYPTPHIDLLASDGLRFNNAFTTGSMCTPARYSIQTGLYPGRFFDRQQEAAAEGEKSEEPYSVVWNTRVGEDTPTLARALNERGYLTGMVGKWHLQSHAYDLQLPSFPEDAELKDEETLELMAKRQQAIQQMVKETAGYTHAASIFKSNAEGEPFVDHHNTPYITKGAVDLLEEFAAAEKPFFLMTAPMAVHGPWHTDVLEKDLRYTPGGFVENLYDFAPDYEQIAEAIEGMSSGEKHKFVGMADMDHHVKVVRETLDRLGLAETTAVIYLSDHGIEPGKASVYDRGNRIPLIIHWPGMTQRGTSTDALAQNIDVSATIAAAAGAGGTYDGVDLRPVLIDPALNVREYVYLEAGFTRSVQDERFKYITLRYPQHIVELAEAGDVEWISGIGSGPGAHAAFALLAYPHYFDPNQFYDLKEDPREMKNLWGQPAVAAEQARLREALFLFTDSFQQPYPREVGEFLQGQTFQTIVERTLRENNPHERETWVERDHDGIPWPPREDHDEEQQEGVQ